MKTDEYITVETSSPNRKNTTEVKIMEPEAYGPTIKAIIYLTDSQALKLIRTLEQHLATPRRMK